MQEGFAMPPWSAMLFFRTCRMYYVTDLRARKDLLRKIVARGKARYFRDAAAYVKGKKIIVIKRGQRDH